MEGGEINKAYLLDPPPLKAVLRNLRGYPAWKQKKKTQNQSLAFFLRDSDVYEKL